MALITVEIEESTLKSENAELILTEIKQYLHNLLPKEPVCNHKWKLYIRPGTLAYKECELCQNRTPL
jgi:hypothetical protein